MSELPDSESNPAGRLRLLEAAVRLFGRDGFDGTSLRALADEAGVSWGLIRFYFGSKEGLRDAAEELVLARYLGLVAARSEVHTMEELVDRIDKAKSLPDDARFLRRALIEEREGTDGFLRQLIALEEQEDGTRALLEEFPDETWMADPIRPVALRLGYLLLAPQFKSLLGRDIFTTAEIKKRNQQVARQWQLMRLGLEAERQAKRKVPRGGA